MHRLGAVGQQMEGGGGRGSTRSEPTYADKRRCGRVAVADGQGQETVWIAGKGARDELLRGGPRRLLNAPLAAWAGHGQHGGGLLEHRSQSPRTTGQE